MPEDILTVGKMLSFINMISYITDHIFQASVDSHKLRQAAKSQIADYIKWTKKLKDNLAKLKEAMNNTILLNAPAPDLQLFLILDTQKLLTDAVLFAKPMETN